MARWVTAALSRRSAMYVVVYLVPCLAALLPHSHLDSAFWGRWLRATPPRSAFRTVNDISDMK